MACVPGIKFGLAFCEASGKCLVRWSGTDPAMVELAQKNAQSLAAGHCFIIFLGDGFYPVNVLNTIKMVPEVCHVFCATANPTEVVLAETQQGRGILGVVDGCLPRALRATTTSRGARTCCARSVTSSDVDERAPAYEKDVVDKLAAEERAFLMVYSGYIGNGLYRRCFSIHEVRPAPRT